MGIDSDFVFISVIVGNFHIRRTSLGPAKADTPLLIDADRVLPRAISTQCLQPIAGWHCQIIQRYSPIQLGQLSQCCCLHVMRKFPRSLAREDPCCFFACERQDHKPYIALLYMVGNHLSFRRTIPARRTHRSRWSTYLFAKDYRADLFARRRKITTAARPRPRSAEVDGSGAGEIVRSPDARSKV